MSDIFDFGFTAVNEDELEAVQQTQAEANNTDERLNNLYKAIMPLLNNLNKNP